MIARIALRGMPGFQVESLGHYLTPVSLVGNPKPGDGPIRVPAVQDSV